MERDLPRVLHRVRTVVWRARFVVAAACCGIAATVAVDALRPPPPDVAHVVVTTREVRAGTALTARDVTTTPVAAELASGLVDDPDDVLGRRAPTSLPAGVPVPRGLVPDDAVRAPAGRVVVAVRLVEPGWLRPGDRVDLLAAAGDDGGTRLARRALVLPAQDPDDDGTSGGLLEGTSPTGVTAPTLLAVDPDEAAELSAASGRDAVVAVLVS